MARDLGRNLAAELDRSEAWLLRFRRLTATARRHAGKDLQADFKRGFLEGLELVATGFERQLKDTKSEEAELEELRHRHKWVQIMEAIRAGFVLPSDLATRCTVVPSRMTALIDELEGAGLVVQASVGNTRPCRLTARAQRLLTKLSPPEPTPRPIPKRIFMEEGKSTNPAPSSKWLPEENEALQKSSERAGIARFKPTV